MSNNLLRMLHAGAPWAYLWSDYSDDPQRHGTSLWYQPERGVPDPPAAWGNVYFGVHGCANRGTPAQRSGQGGDRLSTANCLYADFDAKTWPGGIDAILAHLDDLPRDGLIYPSAMVKSGGGLHAYWIFEVPVNLRKAKNRESVKRAQKIWVDDVVQADPSAKDLGRVLRLPGSLNHKYDPPRPVQLLEFSPTNVFPLRTIGAILDPFIRLEEAKRQRATEARDHGDRAWQKYIDWAYKDAAGGGRHNIGLLLAHRLSEAGCPQPIAETILIEYVEATIRDRETTGEAKRMVRHAYS